MGNFLFNVLTKLLRSLCRHEHPMYIRDTSGVIKFCPDCGKLLKEKDDVR